MKNILIIRPSAIGDVVMASPMIRVLRRHYPEARLAWLVEPPSVDLLRSNTGLDELIIWQKKEWIDLFRKCRFLILSREILEFSRQLREKRFDLVIDAQGLLRSRWLAWLSGARERVGFESKEPGRFLMTKLTTKGDHTGVMGSEYSYMMRVLGLDHEDFHPEIILSQDDENSAHEILEKLKIRARYAVFAPFTTRPQKHWFEDRWEELAGLIYENFGLQSVILGGKDDYYSSLCMKKAAHGQIFNLAGQTSLGQSAAIIKNSSLLIGVDTGLTHMGAAFDCPTIALFGATCPYLYTAGERSSVIYNPMKCSPCRRNPVCDGDFTCMKSINPGDVLKEAVKLLGHHN
jgi:heptosyltransferase I